MAPRFVECFVFECGISDFIHVAVAPAALASFLVDGVGSVDARFMRSA